MILRRGLPLLLATPAMAQASGDYRWRVMRNGMAIGTQSVSFTQRGAERVALSETLIAPTVLGIVVYRYEHRYTEVTRGGRFVSVRSRLNRARKRLQELLYEFAKELHPELLKNDKKE